MALGNCSPSPSPCRWSQTFTLPWPPVKLHPNSAPRNLAAGWAAKKRYRADCDEITRSQLGRGPRPPAGSWVAVQAIFRPPDGRHRDLQNLVAATKHCIDGVSDGIGVNDRLFRPWTVDFGEPIPGGAVVLTLTALAGPPGLPEAMAGLD